MDGISCGKAPDIYIIPYEALKKALIVKPHWLLVLFNTKITSIENMKINIGEEVS